MQICLPDEVVCGASRDDKPDVKGAGVVIHWKRVVFSAALFWFWYLTPVLAGRMEQAHTLAPLASLLGQ